MRKKWGKKRNLYFTLNSCCVMAANEVPAPLNHRWSLGSSLWRKLHIHTLLFCLSGQPGSDGDIYALTKAYATLKGKHNDNNVDVLFHHSWWLKMSDFVILYQQLLLRYWEKTEVTYVCLNENAYAVCRYFNKKLDVESIKSNFVKVKLQHELTSMI